MTPLTTAAVSSSPLPIMTSSGVNSAAGAGVNATTCRSLASAVLQCLQSQPSPMPNYNNNGNSNQGSGTPCCAYTQRFIAACGPFEDLVSNNFYMPSAVAAENVMPMFDGCNGNDSQLP